MAPKNDTNGDSIQFSASETKLLLAAFQYAEGGIGAFKFNKQAVADHLCFASANSAATRWSELRRKIEAKTSGKTSADNEGADEVKKASPKRKKATVEDESEGTPKPKKERKPKAKNGALKKEEHVDDEAEAEAEDEVMVEANEGDTTDAGTLADAEASA